LPSEDRWSAKRASWPKPVPRCSAGDPATAVAKVHAAQAIPSRQMEPEELRVLAKALRALGDDKGARAPRPISLMRVPRRSQSLVSWGGWSLRAGLALEIKSMRLIRIGSRASTATVGAVVGQLDGRFSLA